MKDCHMALATGDDAGAGAGLTAWRNANAAFVSEELIPADKLLGWSYKAPIKTTASHGMMTTSRVAGRHSVGRQIGEWKSKHAFQTCQFCFWLMQTAGAPTTENTPVGYNTHVLTIGASNTPDWHGIHFEREGITSNTLRYDLMGFCPSDLEITVGPNKDSFKAIQEITIPHAYVNRAAADITAQTERPDQATGSLWKTWDHAVTGLGVGKVPAGLTYGGAQLEVDVTNLKIKLHRDQFIGGIPDSSGYYQNGLMGTWKYSFELDVVPTGDLLYTVNNTDKESYAGDLDYDFKFIGDATNDYIKFLADKMYLVPFDEVNDWNKYLEGYTITLEPLDENSSLTVTGIDNLNDNHFENP